MPVHSSNGKQNLIYVNGVFEIIPSTVFSTKNCHVRNLNP